MDSNIMVDILKLRKKVMDGSSLNSILEEFKDFKEKYPKLFELILENKHDYMPELEDMIEHARLVKDGVASLEDVTKVVKNKYDVKYIYPLVNNDKLTSEQKKDTEDMIEKTQKEIEEIRANFGKNIGSSSNR